MGTGCGQSGRQEGVGGRAEEKLGRRAGSGGVRRARAPLPRRLRGGFRADVGPAVAAAAPGAAALGRQVLRVDAVGGAGGARDPGAPGPDPGGGEASHVALAESRVVVVVVVDCGIRVKIGPSHCYCYVVFCCDE